MTSRVLSLVLLAASAWGQAALTWQEKEAFLTKAKVIKTADSKKGITQTERVTLSDGTLTHEASVQRIDQFQQSFTPQIGPTELQFKDSYKFNIAGWKLALLLGMEDMVPPTVERKIGGTAAVTWWVDDVMMDEQERQKQKAESPDTETFRRDQATMYVFDQLIANTDRNQGNIVFDKKWRLWLIDHTRAFRMRKELANPRLVSRVDRNMFEKMKALTADGLKRDMGKYLTKLEIEGLLARRDAIVKIIDAKGEAALMDRPPR